MNFRGVISEDFFRRLAVTKYEINGALDSAAVEEVSAISIPQGVLNFRKPYRIKSTFITVERVLFSLFSLSPPTPSSRLSLSVSSFRWPTEGLYPSVATLSPVFPAFPFSSYYSAPSSLLHLLCSSSGCGRIRRPKSESVGVYSFPGVMARSWPDLRRRRRLDGRFRV
ncbi:hypothetical protein F2Q68_00026006 [Brassica cretica]|uniref:Uncharacterized protein n=1 Tax=Brassica cretica TaxID=69181 RepID=A0A8S9IDJ4_BRACR|nr:hypothetical protein F2Q68_00026006 [Brassica cretica]